MLLSWSSGKDSAWALHVLRARGAHIDGLLTTVNEQHDRVSMHAVRSEVLKRQAAALGLTLHIVELPSPCPNDVYETRMADFVSRATTDGVTQIAFGDIYLEDVRAYREARLTQTPIEPVFPLWGMQTEALASEMIGSGLRAIVTCVDPAQLDPAFVGRRFDAEFLADLPAGTDPCAENGEFHTFAFAGPMFDEPVPITCGETVARDGFFYFDLRLDEN